MSPKECRGNTQLVHLQQGTTFLEFVSFCLTSGVLYGIYCMINLNHQSCSPWKDLQANTVSALIMHSQIGNPGTSNPPTAIPGSLPTFEALDFTFTLLALNFVVLGMYLLVESFLYLKALTAGERDWIKPWFGTVVSLIWLGVILWGWTYLLSYVHGYQLHTTPHNTGLRIEPKILLVARDFAPALLIAAILPSMVALSQFLVGMSIANPLSDANEQEEKDHGENGSGEAALQPEAMSRFLPSVYGLISLINVIASAVTLWAMF